MRELLTGSHAVFRLPDKVISSILNSKAEILFIVSYSFTITLIATYRYYSGQADAWDLGIFQQALYSFAFHGKLFYYTPEIFFYNPSGLFFGIHFSLLMIPLALFYRLLPHAQSLLFLQSLVTAVTIVPLRKICDFVGCKQKNLISFLYLANPLTIYSNLFDFHLEAFVPLFFSFLVLSALKEDSLRTVLWSLALFSVFEYGPILTVAVIVFIFLLRGKSYLRKIWFTLNRASHERDGRFVLVLLVLIPISALYYLISWQVMNHLNPTLPQQTGQFTTALFRENFVMGLSYQAIAKIEYVFLPILCLGFIPFIKPKFLVLSSPFWLLAIISNYAPFYEFGVQYGYLIIPGLIIATIFGISSMQERANIRKFMEIVAVVMTIFVVCLVTLIGANTVPYDGLGPGATTKIPSPNLEAQYQLTTLIPNNASVLVWSDAFPYVANNLQAYSVPTDYRGTSEGLYKVMNETISLKPEYLLLNTNFGLLPLYENFSSFIDSNYGVYAEDYGNLLLRWHYEGSIHYFKGYSMNFDTQEFQPPHSLRDIYYWHGPWTSILPGRYTVSITYLSNLTSTIDFLITTRGGTVILSSESENVTSTQNNTPHELTVSFLADFPYDNVEFLVSRIPNLNMTIVNATITEVSFR
jgi:uncharacterized membrane protein